MERQTMAEYKRTYSGVFNTAYHTWVAYKVDQNIGRPDGAELQGHVYAKYSVLIDKLGRFVSDDDMPLCWTILLSDEYVTKDKIAINPIHDINLLTGDSALYIFNLFLVDDGYKDNPLMLEKTHGILWEMRNEYLRFHVGGTSPNVVKFATALLDSPHNELV